MHTWWFAARAWNKIETFCKLSNSLPFDWSMIRFSFIQKSFFFSAIFVHLLNLLRAIVAIATICVYHLSQTKRPSENIFSDASGFVLLLCKSWAVQSFEVCPLGWMRLSPGRRWFVAITSCLNYTSSNSQAGSTYSVASVTKAPC